ncbi:MAG: L-histidine N(alpha)-methyltransferase [Microcystaceae cyanobacterium]
MLSQIHTSPLTFKFLGHFSEANAQGEDVKQGLKQPQKTLPPYYFYDDYGSELFEQICELPEYYPTRTEASILTKFADEIATITEGCKLIELGSGSSTKTRILLDAYQKLSYPWQYIPIDVSGGMLKSSSIQLQKDYPSLAIHGLVGTYHQALTYLQSHIDSPRLLFFLGSSIGNFNQQQCEAFLTEISQALTPHDYFLLGLDLQKPIAILESAYNDSLGVTAQFNLNMLSHLNRRFQGDFDLGLFQHKAVYNTSDNQIEMYLNCQQNHTVTLDALDLHISCQKGEKILTEISRKFDLELMKQQLNQLGLTPIETFTDEQNWFGLILCKKSIDSNSPKLFRQK